MRLFTFFSAPLSPFPFLFLFFRIHQCHQVGKCSRSNWRQMQFPILDSPFALYSDSTSPISFRILLVLSTAHRVLPVNYRPMFSEYLHEHHQRSSQWKTHNSYLCDRQFLEKKHFVVKKIQVVSIFIKNIRKRTYANVYFQWKLQETFHARWKFSISKTLQRMNWYAYVLTEICG